MEIIWTFTLKKLFMVHAVCTLRILTSNIVPSFGKSTHTDEQALLKELGLFNRQIYDNSVRPVYNSSDSVVIYFEFSLTQIMDMDEKNQVLITNAWLIHKWTDDRIKWNITMHNGLKKIRIPASLLWLPDIVLYNNADDYTSGFMPINAMVEYDGSIFWSPPSRLRSACKVDITYFPFDSQYCQMKFGSWTYDKAQVDLVPSSDIVDVGDYTTNGEWMLKKYTIHREETKYPASTEIYSDIKVTLIIQRRILYYVLNIIFPCFWLNVLSVLTFCLPPDAGEKITLSITVLLSYSVFMLLVAESMPPTSEFVPLIGIYLTVSMASASVSVVLTVLVLKLHHCSPKQTRVPGIIRVAVLGILAKLVRCSCKGGVKSIKRVYKTRGEQRNKGQGDSDSVTTVMESQFVSKFQHSTLKNDTCDTNVHLITTYRDSLNTDETISLLEGDKSCPAMSREHKPSTLDTILKYIKTIVTKHEEDEEEEEIVDEWKQVSLVVDRLLFWIFLFITLFSTIIILVVVPSFSYSMTGGI